MMVFEEISRLELGPGDKVVTACQFRDYVVIITERGNVFRIKHEEHDR